MNEAKSKWVKLYHLPALLCILFFAFPSTLSQGKDQWENRGDAKFFVASAEHWLNHGNFRWYEIYPIALKAESKPEMGWSAIGQPLAIATLHQLGFGSMANSAIWASTLSWCLGLFLIYFVLAKWTKDELIGWVGLWAGFLLTPSFLFAQSGSSESLSQLFLLSGVGLVCLVLRNPHRYLKVLLFLVLFLGCFIRPHNQFLYLATVSLIFFIPGKKEKIIFTALWFCTGLSFYIAGKILTHGTELRFPYLFSFLVNTPEYPGHELFRHYRNGFGFQDLWAEREVLITKVATGWAFLKQYWTGWLPSLFVIGLCWIPRSTRAFASIGSLVFAASLFFSWMSHPVPRYYQILDPLIVLIALICLTPVFLKSNWAKGGLALMLFMCFFIFRGEHFKQKDLMAEPIETQIPEQIMEHIPQKGWIACARPASCIESLNRPLMLLPQDLGHVDRLREDQIPIQAILFDPSPHSELEHWDTLETDLKKRGFSKISKEDWTLYYQESSAESKSPTNSP